MIFLRTPGGISHDPAESVLADDVAKAIEAGLYLLEQLADAPRVRCGALYFAGVAGSSERLR